MVTESGMAMLTGMVLCLISVICFVIMVRHYQGKGAVFSAVYFSSTKEARAKMRTKEMYRKTGYVYLYTAVVTLLFGLSYMFESEIFGLTGAEAALFGVLSAFLSIYLQKK